jgi:hypothetical protein
LSTVIAQATLGQLRPRHVERRPSRTDEAAGDDRPARGGQQGPPRDLLVELRRFGWSLSDNQYLKGCGRQIRRGDVGTAAEVLDLTVDCRRKWLCPTCGHRAAGSQSTKCRRALLDWRARGGSIAFMTLTQRHSIDDELTESWDRLQCGGDRLKQGAGWNRDREAYGLSGYTRVTEVVHHPASGWNVHLHVVLRLAHALTDGQQDDLKAGLFARFARGVRDRGGDANLAGQDLRPVRAGTEGRVASYCFKGTTQYQGPDGSRSPMAILSDLNSTGEGLPCGRSSPLQSVLHAGRK